MDTLQPDGAEIGARATTGYVTTSRETKHDSLQTQLEKLFSCLRIAVVFGGDKSVDGAVINPTLNPRSWKSYEAVAQDIADALKRIGFQHVSMAPDDMRLASHLQNDNIHLAWLNSGGVQGYNPMCHTPAILEMMGLPYVGHDPLTMGTLDNKHAFKRDLACLGIPTAPFMTWHLSRGAFRPKMNSRFIRIFKNHWGPYIVKPVSGRASLHVHVVDKEADLPDAVAEVFHQTQNHVLIEAYLPGREYCVAVSGPVVARERQLFKRADPFIFSACERILDADERIVTSMDVRPITDDRIRALHPGRDATEFLKLEDIARAVYLDFNLEFLTRLDLRTNSAGEIFLLEANPKPDLKFPTKDVTSVVCVGLRDQGMDYDDLILSLLGNRLDFLLNHRRQQVPQLIELCR